MRPSPSGNGSEAGLALRYTPSARTSAFRSEGGGRVGASGTAAELEIPAFRPLWLFTITAYSAKFRGWLLSNSPGRLNDTSAGALAGFGDLPLLEVTIFGDTRLIS